MGPFTDQQLITIREAVRVWRDEIAIQREVKPSIRALMMADCNVIIDAVREEFENGARSEPDHQGG